MNEFLPTWLLTPLIIVAVIHVLFALVYSRDILVWVPSAKRKIKLLLLIWLVPLYGLKWANQRAKLGWFEARKDTSGDTLMGAGLFEIDAIFNPGARHRVVAVQEHKVKVAKKSDEPLAPSIKARSKSSPNAKISPSD